MTRLLIQRLNNIYSLLLLALLLLVFKNRAKVECSKLVSFSTTRTNNYTNKTTRSDNNNNIVSSAVSLTSSSPVHPDSAMVQEELMENTWDYMTELVFIPFLAILSIPANIFLFGFYARKVRLYKRLKHFNLRYASVANSFHSYMIEISAFDIVIVVYLILNSTFHLLYFLKKSQYESVYDVSNFACKFFIYILRISGAMSNYLVFLLSLNRCFLLIFRPNEDEINSHRLCLNTKYLTLFLFCLCTIANVFRLELLYLNSSQVNNNNSISSSISNNNMNNNTSTHHQSMITMSPFGMNKMLAEQPDDYETDTTANETTDIVQQLTHAQIMQMISEAVAQKPTECGPNIGSIDYKADSTHNKLFWSIIIYNIIFAILPAFGNLATSVYLIRKRHQLKGHLVYLSERIDELRSKSHAYLTLLRTHSTHKRFKNEPELVEEEPGGENVQEMEANDEEVNEVKNIYFEESLIRDLKNLQITEYQAEFLRTCSPCIAFSLTHVLLFLPYSCIEMINQISTDFTLLQALQYMTYARYLFYSCKFYLLFLVSYRFRRETINCFRRPTGRGAGNKSDCEINLLNSFRKLNIYRHHHQQQQQQQTENNNNNNDENVVEQITVQSSKNKLNIIVNNS